MGPYRKDVHKQTASNPNELKQCCKKRVGQNPSTMMREIDKLYRKPLLKVNAATDASTSYQNVGVYLVFTGL